MEDKRTRLVRSIHILHYYHRYSLQYREICLLYLQELTLQKDYNGNQNLVLCQVCFEGCPVVVDPVLEQQDLVVLVEEQHLGINATTVQS